VCCDDAFLETWNLELSSGNLELGTVACSLESANMAGDVMRGSLQVDFLGNGSTEAAKRCVTVMRDA
jgi:hypothetical protein